MILAKLNDACKVNKKSMIEKELHIYWRQTFKKIRQISTL